eukprot:CAMPEP_0118689294 /NCGR_PEP_ID=MMETSP0800-20121206/9409_1 /TAXON_ID=210618 ORGANISM="Striatella unipunctata, Strain CCMP2910" /NCGR_SAMPLE_ID=MMETSP0800 /ASSEMBLY_ACC=CAM_ASM_000638 /LENGTH=194 /DNA_ID=CAMNT_0006586675 /DNA_START=1 /DNA_END=586 /DNA_ORIENTATION=-
MVATIIVSPRTECVHIPPTQNSDSKKKNTISHHHHTIQLKTLGEGLELYKQKYGPSHPMVTFLMMSMAQEFRNERNFHQAIQYLTAALEAVNSKTQQVIDITLNLANVYKEMECIPEAVRYYKNALMMVQQPNCSIANKERKIAMIQRIIKNNNNNIIFIIINNNNNNDNDDDDVAATLVSHFHYNYNTEMSRH